MFDSDVPRAAFITSLGAALVALPMPAFAVPAVADLADLARHRASIARVTVYSLAGDISTMVAVTPAALETFPGVRVRTSTARARIDALIDALRHARPVGDPDPFDARFGIVFADRFGRRCFAAYTNAGASQGVIGHRSVAFDNATPLATALRNASH